MMEWPWRLGYKPNARINCAECARLRGVCAWCWSLFVYPQHYPEVD